MKKLSLILIRLILLSPYFSNAQTQFLQICTYGEDNKGAEICTKLQLKSFKSSIEAQNAVDRILEPTGLKSNFVLVPCDGINNCAALVYVGLRYIIYDNAFMEKVADIANTDWTNLGILAHEIGHHLLGHTLMKTNNSDTRRDELEADEWSGFALNKIGATLEQAQAAINSLWHPACDEEINYDHPCKQKRLDSIKKGWEKAKGQKSNTNINNSIYATDPAGKTYKTVNIGSQVWMAENLAYKTSSGCWAPKNDESNVTIFGYLYNWETAQNICPIGWHLPSDAEWTILLNFLGGEEFAASKLKESGTAHWQNNNFGSNTTGFTALPAGLFDNNITQSHTMGRFAYWWTSTENKNNKSGYFCISIDDIIGHPGLGSASKDLGLSIRCIKD